MQSFHNKFKYFSIKLVESVKSNSFTKKINSHYFTESCTKITGQFNQMSDDDELVRKTN